MLTSKLTLISFTWIMAFLVSIALRLAGIIHAEPFELNEIFVLSLVFAPSFFFLIYFLLKRSFFANSSIWFSSDFRFCTQLFYFHFKQWCTRFIDIWKKYWCLVNLCTYFFWVNCFSFCFGVAHRIFIWKSITKIQ